MKKYLEILRNCKLFESIEDENQSFSGNPLPVRKRSPFL